MSATKNNTSNVLTPVEVPLYKVVMHGLTPWFDKFFPMVCICGHPAEKHIGLGKHRCTESDCSCREFNFSREEDRLVMEKFWD